MPVKLQHIEKNLGLDISLRDMAEDRLIKISKKYVCVIDCINMITRDKSHEPRGVCVCCDDKLTKWIYFAFKPPKKQMILEITATDEEIDSMFKFCEFQTLQYEQLSLF